MDTASKRRTRAARRFAVSLRPYRRILLLTAPVLGVVFLGVGASSVAWAQPDTTTSPTAPTTTTTVPPTTTSSTSPPTTRTTATSHPTTTVPATTSTSSTTTTVPTHHSSSSDTWLLVVIGVAAAVLVALIAVIVAGRRRRRANSAWLPSARTALDSAQSARDLLLSEPSDADAATHEAIRAKVAEAARMLDGASTRAPDDEARAASHDAAEELRGLLFAVEAQRLLPTGRTPPTADQLAQADLQRRTREAELQRALLRLGRRVRTDT